jgi:hypothetical protein
MKMKGDENPACRAGLDPPFDYGGSRSTLRLLAGDSQTPHTFYCCGFVNFRLNENSTPFTKVF